ncbi:hypothetical protein Glove_130g27 [Diversispora epigaea]|uniref:Uncharacterized protein n=1 Tax=Diversispora epigaea TaxID=1348612 RepID=A0A397J267_9GLOM|nr:hypothetical protein Glove_130g27 [Diversispora epigaea]
MSMYTKEQFIKKSLELGLAGENANIDGSSKNLSEYYTLHSATLRNRNDTMDEREGE